MIYLVLRGSLIQPASIAYHLCKTRSYHPKLSMELVTYLPQLVINVQSDAVLDSRSPQIFVVESF